MFMSRTPQQAVRDASYSLGAIFDSIIGEVTEDIETVETGDIEIDDTSPPDVDHPPEDSPTAPTMVNSIIIWGDIHGYKEVSVFSKPKIGGLLVDETITDN